MFLLNAFSLDMINGDADLSIRQIDLSIRQIDSATARSLAAVCVSAVCHADTAAVFADVLGVPVPCNRASVSLNPGDAALVGQYSGPRLAEGATTLPEGATIKWMVVGVHAPLLVDL